MPMRRLLFTLLLLLCCSGIASAQSRGPRMSFDHSSYDFGDVQRRGGDLVKEFRFVNDGDKPLVIKKITKSCSCMTVTYSRKPVMPGDRAVIKIVGNINIDCLHQGVCFEAGIIFKFF